MKNLENYNSFVNEGSSPQLSDWKEKFNPDHQEMYDALIAGAKEKGNGTASAEDLLTVLAAFDLIGVSPAEMLAIYAKVKGENPEITMRHGHSPDHPSVKAVNLVGPYLASMKRNPAYGEEGGFDVKRFLGDQGKFEF